MYSSDSIVIRAGGFSQYSKFQARGYPINKPDKCPRNDDLGIINLVIINKATVPKLIGKETLPFSDTGM
jgi:hypothetical protein